MKRKLIRLGKSKGVTLPASWIADAEEKAGKKMVAVSMEVNGHIVINPVFKNGEN